MKRRLQIIAVSAASLLAISALAQIVHSDKPVSPGNAPRVAAGGVSKGTNSVSALRTNSVVAVTTTNVVTGTNTTVFRARDRDDRRRNDHDRDDRHRVHGSPTNGLIWTTTNGAAVAP